MSTNEDIVDFPNWPPTPKCSTSFLKYYECWVRMRNGKVYPYGFIHLRRSAVAIVALNQRKELSLVTQHRYPFGLPRLTELPKGFAKDNEEPEVAAKRELQEEVKVIASQFQSLGEMAAAPGIGRIIRRY